MSTGTTEEFIAHRLKQLAELGLLFTYVVEGDKHWLKSKWGYWLSWPTAKQVDGYLAGMEHGAEYATRQPAPSAEADRLAELQAQIIRVYEKARDREYDEMLDGRQTNYHCQLGDAGHVMGQVEDDLKPIVEALAAYTKSKEAEL